MNRVASVCRSQHFHFSIQQRKAEDIHSRQGQSLGKCVHHRARDQPAVDGWPDGSMEIRKKRLSKPGDVDEANEIRLTDRSCAGGPPATDLQVVPIDFRALEFCRHGRRLGLHGRSLDAMGKPIQY